MELNQSFEFEISPAIVEDTFALRKTPCTGSAIGHDWTAEIVTVLPGEPALSIVQCRFCLHVLIEPAPEL